VIKLLNDRFKLNAVAHVHESYIKILSFVANFYVNGIVEKDSKKAFSGKFTTSKLKGCVA